MYPAGWRIEPPVSPPIEKTVYSLATFTADPPLEPPATNVGSIAFYKAKKMVFSLEDPWPKLSQFSFTNGIAPASNNFWIAVAVYGDL